MTIRKDFNLTYVDEPGSRPSVAVELDGGYWAVVLSSGMARAVTELCDDCGWQLEPDSTSTLALPFDFLLGVSDGFKSA